MDAFKPQTMAELQRMVPVTLVVLVLAACGTPAAQTPAASASVEPAAGSSTTAGCSAGTRSVAHAVGSACVPLVPKRIGTLDPFFTLTPVVELGLPVVGSVNLGADDPFPGLTEQERAGIEQVGSGEPNLEAVAALQPDLIIGVDFVNPAYDQLSEIAPTVIIKTALDWKQQHRALADATGTTAQAEQGIAAYEARVQDLKARVPDVTVSVISNNGEQPLIYTLGPAAFAPVRILDEVGVKRPADEVTQSTDPNDFAKEISVEVLPQLGGDVLLYTAGFPGMDDATRQQVAERLNDPLWQQIPAVKNGRAYQVDGRCWEVFGGLRSANCVLDEIEKYVIEQPQASNS